MKKEKIILSLLVIVGLITALVVSTYGVRLITKIFEKATSATGNSTITLSPTSGNYTPGQINSIVINTNIPSDNNVDGVQIVANIYGISSDQLTFNPTVPANMNLVYNSIMPGGATQSSILKLIYISSSPSAAIQGSSYKLGSIAFDSTKVDPNVTISFDAKLSKIAQNLTTNDILLGPQKESYFFGFPPTPTPVATVSPEPTFTPKPTATPTATPTPKPTPNSAPVISTTSLPTGYVGKKYSATITVYDVNINDQLVINTLGWPVQINTVKCTRTDTATRQTYNCVYSGTPKKSGVYKVTVTADDGRGGKASKTLKLVISANLGR